MKSGLTFTFLLLLCVVVDSKAQQFIGTILYRNTHQYIKINFEKAEGTFTLPYLDGDKVHSLEGGINDSHWIGYRGVEQWIFQPETNGQIIAGELQLPTGSQNILLHKQLDPVLAKDFEKYAGEYTDEHNRKVIIYAGPGFLRIMSPYSEETMSLKPIGPNQFWTTSGETFLFSDYDNKEYTMLTVGNKINQKVSLKRIPPIQIKELWIPVGKDTLFAKIFLPPAEINTPACLILPGGGNTGMDNYLYEARLLAANGIASMVFDKSGNGNSKGPGNFQLQTFEEKNDQYKALFHYLRNYQGIDPTKVGIHGPSEGGRLSLMMAIDLQDTVAFVNATAAPLMNLVDNQLYALNHYHRNMGVSEIDNARILTLWSLYYQEIFNRKINQSTIDGFNALRSKNPRLFIPGTSTQVPASPTKEDLYNDRVVKEAGKITCPVFLQYGENDLRVDRVKSVRNFLPMLNQSVPVKTYIYERGDHSFMTPEYKICPGYADDKIQWLKSIGIL